MHEVILVIAGQPVTVLEICAAAAAVALLLLLSLVFAARSARRERQWEASAAAERQRELDDRVAALREASAEMTGRMQTMAEVLSSRQADLARVMSERLDSVGARMGQSLEQTRNQTTENLTKLNERLAVIDQAQTRLTGLTQDVVGLKDILANKQARGAFGQGRMEAIVRDGLPTGAYEFQAQLSNGTRPDCVVRLPSTDLVMVIDAKFPLEAFSALKDARSDEERKQARARVRADIGVHLKQIADKYFLPGETQDLAALFVPSESIYADLNEHFDDVIQKGHRARIILVSPSLLMMMIQVMQSIVRDARMREEAHLLQKEVRLLVEDVTRLRERAAKLDGHFRQAQDDVEAVGTSAGKIARRGERIGALDFTDAANAAAVPAVAAPPAAPPRQGELLAMPKRAMQAKG